MSVESTDAKEEKAVTDVGTESPYGDLFIGSFFLLFAVLMFLGALFFPYRSNMGFVTAAKFTPMVVALLVAILAIALVVGAYLKAPRTMPISVWFRAVITDDHTRRFVVLAVTTGAYTLLVGVVPFIVVTFVYFLVIYSYLKIGGIVRILGIAALSSIIVAYAVPTVFQMPLP